MADEKSLALRAAERMSEGVYEPGQYAKRDDMQASSFTIAADGTVSFTVYSSVPNETREEVTVTVSPGRWS